MGGASWTERSHFLAAALLIAVAATSARAVVTIGDHPAGAADPALTEEFADFPYWSHIAHHGVGTGVYLGWGWMMRPAHVWGDPVELNGQPYARDTSVSVRRIRNADNSNADLVVFKILDPPDLPPMLIARTPIEVGDAVLMAGYGRPPQPQTYEWSVNKFTIPSWTWTTPPDPNEPGHPIYSGYWVIEGTRLNFWGVNTIEQIDVPVSNEFGQSPAFLTRFTHDLEDARVAQAVGGDSGAPAWRKVDDRWELAGVAIDVPTLSGQPAGNRTAIFEHSTSIFAELAVYRDAILEIIKPALPGDFNDDGVVNTADINPFILALTNIQAWEDQNPYTLVSKVDFNGDGVINTADINLFIQTLTSQGGTQDGEGAIIPEPSAAGILLLACLWSVSMTRRRMR
jgi:hypothetical protein